VRPIGADRGSPRTLTPRFGARAIFRIDVDRPFAPVGSVCKAVRHQRRLAARSRSSASVAFAVCAFASLSEPRLSSQSLQRQLSTRLPRLVWLALRRPCCPRLICALQSEQLS